MAVAEEVGLINQLNIELKNIALEVIKDLRSLDELPEAKETIKYADSFSEINKTINERTLISFYGVYEPNHDDFSFTIGIGANSFKVFTMLNAHKNYDNYYEVNHIIADDDKMIETLGLLQNETYRNNLYNDIRLGVKAAHDIVSDQIQNLN